MPRNPLELGLRLPRTPDPCALVIFGASGDLTRRKLFPALWSLAVRDLLPERFAIVGVARSEGSDDEFRARMKEAVREFGRDPIDERIWKRLAGGMRYIATDFANDRGEDRVVDVLDELDRKRGTGGNRLFYLAIPPSAIATVAEKVGARRGEWGGWTRMIVEKPFGTDRDSARRLNDEIHATFEEREIFRIDHYLGKETVQNLLALRFANGIFEPIWNRQLRRPRADHRRGVDRRRGPGRLLRACGRDARHVPEPPAPARRPDRDGAADRLLRRRRCETRR